MRVVEFTHHVPSLNSKVVKKVWYASTTRELFVEAPNGVQYGYKDVSPAAYDKFLASDSKGRFYNNHIKGVYKSTGDYGNVEFRSAPGLSQKHTVAGKNPWGSSTVFTGPTPNVATAPLAKPTLTRYTVSGLVLKPTPTSKSYMAESLEDAMKKFREDFAANSPDVTEVRKS